MGDALLPPPPGPEAQTGPGAVPHPALPTAGAASANEPAAKEWLAQLPRPGQVCVARGAQTAGQAERHL